MIRRSFLKRVLTGIPALSVSAAEGQSVLHVRVTERATGEIIPATVLIRTSAGDTIIDTEAFRGGFRTSGEFSRYLPAGLTLLRVTRGFDFEAWEQELLLKAGEQHDILVRLARRTPLNNEGWRCGDNHVHMIHGESRISVDFDYVGLTAAAEGLDYMSVAQRWRIANPTATAIEAECRRVSRPDCMITWNMEAPKNYFRGNVSHCLGHGWFVGARGRDSQGRDVIDQLFEMNAGDYQSEKIPTPNFETHALIHAQGGVVSYTHPCRWWFGKWGGKGIYPIEEQKFVSNLAQELPFDTLAGPTYDTLDILMQTREKEVNAQGQQLWYELLNHGYRIAGTACTDATFDNPGRAVPGKVRLYTKTDDGFSLPALVSAMKAGRNFVSSGPLLTLDVSGHHPGDVLSISGPTKVRASIRAWASPGKESALSEIELIQNGESLKRFPISSSERSIETTFEWTLEGSGWVIARCFGSDRDNEVALTNPVYWRSPDFSPPEPVAAYVDLHVAGESGDQANARCTVFERVGADERIIATHMIQEGRLKLRVPATARLRVEASECVPETRSIFLDSPEILEATLNMRVEQLLSWSTFERLSQALANVRLDIRLRKS